MTDQGDQKIGLRSLVAQGWVLMFLLFICIILTETAMNVALGQKGMLDEERGGMDSVQAIAVLMMIHAAMPLLIYTVSAVPFRWFVVAFTGVLSVAMLAHETVDIVQGWREFGLMHVLDLSHHALGIFMMFVATKWARQGRRAGVPVAEPSGAP